MTIPLSYYVVNFLFFSKPVLVVIVTFEIKSSERE